jgi:hypothetical protein
MRTEIKALFVSAAAATFCLFLGGCPGKLRDPGRFTDAGVDGGGGGAMCPDVPTEILAMKCAGSSCHSGAMPALKLDLVSPGVAARVVGVMATECKGALVDPAAPESSILYQKIAGTMCGSRMPLGTPLDDAEIACVKEWMSAQAPSGSTSAGTGTGTSGAGGAGGMGAGGAATSSSTGP